MSSYLFTDAYWFDDTKRDISALAEQLDVIIAIMLNER
jgi:hypothetical protein